MSARTRPFVSTTLRFSADIVGWLEQRADEEGAPRQSIFVAAVFALLARYAGRDDVWLLVHAEGQARRVYLRLDGDPDPWQLLGKTAIALSAALTPGTSERPESQRDDVRVEQTIPGATGGVVVAVTLDATRPAPEADLIVQVERQSVNLQFRASRFEAVAVSRVAEHLRALIVGLTQATVAVSAIPIVHGEERAWMLARSNATAIDLEETLPTVVQCFEQHVRATPHAVAVVDGPRELTYGQLDAAANGLCESLIERGLRPGLRVATYLERGADAIIAFLGILKARATYVPIDTSYPRGRVAGILATAVPALIVTRASAVATLSALADAVTPLALLTIDDNRPATLPCIRPGVRPDDVAYTFFTSGSTGQPKGVVVDHRALANYVRAAADAYGLGPQDRVLQAASLGFDLSLEEIVITLTAGATLVIRSSGPIESVQAFFEECRDRQLSVLSITSALWHELTLRLADGSVQMPPAIRLMILGADVARPDVLAAWQRATAGRVRLINTYGLTETTIVATVWEASEQPLEGEWRALPIGSPLRNVSAYVLDARGELVPVGVAGEICIGGLAVAREYLGDDELTRARFVPDPFVRGGWMYRSGDRGILRSSGDLEFLGRADYRVKVQGVRIELGEIEARLREYPGVVEAVAVARTNLTGETELDAHVMVTASEVTSGQLRTHLQSLLPPAAVPGRVNVVDRLPLTAAGKIDRRALAAAPPEAGRSPYVAPQTPLEKLVATTTAEVLAMPQVGLHDGFLLLGGSSLSAVRAASVLGARLGRRVTAQLFLECPTLADVCAALERPSLGPRESARPVRALEADAVLAPGVVVTNAARQQQPYETVLLTGATGYFGAFVLAELLRETSAQIICLVRAPSPELAQARVLASLARRGCVIDPDALARRLSSVCGDVSRPRFDLTPDAFARLSERADAIVHAAARVSMLLPYDALRASNALALEWVLQLAATGRRKTVHHVSTVEVLCDMQRDNPLALTERRVAPSPALLEGGYGQSKWVAEKLVEQARERGVRAYIHRPGRLTGHSLSGAFNDDDFLVHLLDACGRIGAVPILDVDVDMTPVDTASRALVKLAMSESELPISHLVHPTPSSWSALVDVMISLGYPLRAVPHSRWCSMLHDLTARDERTTFLHYLATLSTEETQDSLRGGHATEATSAALGSGFEWPVVDAKLLSAYLRAMADAGRFWLGPSPKRSSIIPPSARSSGQFIAIGR